MKKKYLILNYIMFSVFFIMIVLNNYLLKPNINLKKINTPKALDIKLIINPSKNIEMNFDDFLEITKNTNNKVKLIKIKKNNLEIIPLKNKLEQKTKFQKVLKKDLKLDAFNNHKIIPLVIEKKEFLDIQTKNNAEIYKNISKGKLLLKHNKKFDISFKWPVNNNSHDLIYEKLSKCLNVKTVILSENGIFYSLDLEGQRSCGICYLWYF